MKAYVLVNPANNRLVDNKISNYPDCLPDYKVIFGPNVNIGVIAPDWYKNEPTGRQNKSVISNGYCAYLGHLSGLLSHMDTYPDDELLILEDDVQFNPRFCEYFNNFMKMVPADWDIVYLGGWPVGDMPIEVVPNVLRPATIYGLECVLLKPDMVKQLVSEITEGGSKCGLQVDVALASLSRQRRITAYMPIIKFAYQPSAYSAHFNKLMNKNAGNYRYFKYVDIDGNVKINSEADLDRYADK